MCTEQLVDLARNILLLLAGWLLGLLSPMIDSARKKRVLLREVRQGIAADLDVASLKLTTHHYRLCLKSAGVSRDLLAWIEPRIRRHGHVAEKPEILRVIEEMKEMDNGAFTEYNKELIDRESKSSPTLKRIELPYLMSNLGLLGAFGRKVRVDALEVISYLQSLNAEIDLAWWFYQKTLEPSVMMVNSDLVIDNLNATYGNLADMCRREVELIEKLEEHLAT
jgi:hypothetical protein